MIFVTVGTDLPFDRLMKVVDSWARRRGRRDIFAQIGEGGWQPGFIEWQAFLEPHEYRQRFDEARLIVSHAGMGTIISALRRGKPILVMPKRAALGEHRSDHQVDTAEKMHALGHVAAAFGADELRAMLDRADALGAPRRIGPFAQPSLTGAIHRFIHAAPPVPRRT